MPERWPQAFEVLTQATTTHLRRLNSDWLWAQQQWGGREKLNIMHAFKASEYLSAGQCCSWQQASFVHLAAWLEEQCCRFLPRIEAPSECAFTCHALLLSAIDGAGSTGLSSRGSAPLLSFTLLLAVVTGAAAF